MKFSPNISVRRQLYTIFVALAIGVPTLSVISFTNYLNIRNDTYTSGFLFYGLLFISAAGFFIRQRLRKTYGVLEFLLGVFFTSTSIKSVYPTLESLMARRPVDILNEIAWTSVIPGIYFIIRGFDNIGKGLKADKIKAEAYNAPIEANWQLLVELEAKRLWTVRGMPNGSDVKNWNDAEINIFHKKKNYVFANIWSRIFGFD